MSKRSLLVDLLALLALGIFSILVSAQVAGELQSEFEQIDVNPHLGTENPNDKLILIHYLLSTA